MDHVGSVRLALDYIEGHLREELSAEDVAGAVHFSVSHFHSIFAKVTGCTLADFVRRRRLACAAYDLARSHRRILDIAMDYRFESQEVFTRAFQRVYGITPGALRQHGEFATTLPHSGLYHSKDAVLEGVNEVSAAKAVGSPVRYMLENVPRVGFYNGGDQCPEQIPFPSCLAACVRYMGDDYPWLPLEAHGARWRLNYANVHILGASGMAFGLLWKTGWHINNTDLMMVADPREIIRRAFESVGYTYEVVPKTGRSDDTTFRAKIAESLRGGRPVLGFGVVGPPVCCLITGYDEGGDVVLGWSYFQDDPEFNTGVTFEPAGYFRKPRWGRDTKALIIVRDKVQSAAAGERNRDTLRWALQIIRTPKAFGRHSGLAAYPVWAKQVLRGESFPFGGEAAKRAHHEVHDAVAAVLAECRLRAAIFLRTMAEGEPAMRADLLAAADLYTQEHDLLERLRELSGGGGNPEAFRQFADPAVRKELAQLILQARDLDSQAAEQIEKAITR
ncbi:MAG TPA: AraC family transcriptional regulator [Symbiobacteriaceae bacterium]|nr:AraC family transcriptional regulator [Symbiobacteriaceae bacterium]